MKIKKILAALTLGILSASPVLAADKIRIVTTTTTLASITGAIAKDKAEIYSIASPNRDIHFYAPTPKDVLKVKKADVLVHGGLDLESWREPLLNAAGNQKFLSKGPSSIDVSTGIPLLEIPDSVSRAHGDIHFFGNPHYAIDPENAKIMARNIARGLTAAYPENADFFKKNAEDFVLELDERIKDWMKRMAPYQGAPVVTYHRDWSYFAKRFGLVLAGELEPKPGIPPTAKHISQLSETMKQKGVKVIITESFCESKTPKKIASETGAKVLVLSQNVGEMKKTGDYSAVIENNIQLLEQALGAQGGR